MTTPTSATFRDLLKNEVTWVILVATLVLGFVKTVVLPIQDVQLTVTQIKVELVKMQTQSDDLNRRMNTLEQQGVSREERLRALEKH